MLGLIIGAASGCVSFFLLSRYTGAITGGRLNTRIVLLGIFQFFIPLIILLAVALFLRSELLWAGIGTGAALIGCSVIRFMAAFRRLKGGK